jgi:hypothetical protein
MRISAIPHFAKYETYALWRIVSWGTRLCNQLRDPAVFTWLTASNGRTRRQSADEPRLHFPKAH